MNQPPWVENLPILTKDEVCLREVAIADAAALVELFARSDVSAHLSPPPANVEEFSSWIGLNHERRSQHKAACYTLLTGPDNVAGLFMAMRLETEGHAEVGFAIAPQLWGTGVFMKTAVLYLTFLFDEWAVTTLMGRTLERNARGVGAMRKLGATVIERRDFKGEPELAWMISAADWKARTPPP